MVQRKSQPFSIRLSLATDLYVSAEARRTKRSKGAVVEALAEEAARMRRFPGISYRGDDARRRAWVRGTGTDVWMLIQMLREYNSIADLGVERDWPVARILVAQKYYESYPDEIDERIADNDRSVEEWMAMYPTFGVIDIDPAED